MEVDDIQTHQACKFSRVANGSKLDSSKLTHHNHHHHLIYPHDDDTRNNANNNNHHYYHTSTTGTTTANIATSINGLPVTPSPAHEMGSAPAAGATDEGGGGNSNRFRHWQHSNRIIRVSRASGGKDRHSKVWTAKGPRDRRVRLSVTTAIQFYDLQDRLGFDQPSKAVEWLIKAAAESIAELPALDTGPFCIDQPPGSSLPLLSNEDHNRRVAADNGRSDLAGGSGGGCLDSARDIEVDDDNGTRADEASFGQNQHGTLVSKSACSSTSETSKGSGLSLSRSRTEIRVKARERARERAAKEKEKENDSKVVNNVNVNVNPLSNSQGGSSFTQLLTAGIGMGNADNTSAVTTSSPSAAHSGRQWTISSSSAPMAMDYFNILGMASSSSSSSSRGGGGGGGGGNYNSSNNGSNQNHTLSGFPGHIQLGNSMSQALMLQPFSDHHHHHHHSELQQFPFVPDNLVQNSAAAAGNDYNLNFSISSSSGLAGFSRGTLQSNSPSLLPHIQRFSSFDGPSVPFFLGTAVTTAAATPHADHHHHQFPPGLQLSYGGGRLSSDQKGEGKN